MVFACLLLLDIFFLDHDLWEYMEVKNALSANIYADILSLIWCDENITDLEIWSRTLEQILVDMVSCADFGGREKS